MLEEAVANGKVFTRRNPAVLWGYRSLTSVQTELARTFQRLAKYDQAIEAWEDVARVNEGLTQRDPRNPDYPYERINALVSVHDIEKSRSHRAQAASALERALTGASETIQTHPTSAGLLRVLMFSFLHRGELEKDAEHTQEAVRFFLEGMSFYEKHHGPSGEADAEALKQYIECASMPMPVSPSSRICPRRSGSSSVRFPSARRSANPIPPKLDRLAWPPGGTLRGSGTNRQGHCKLLERAR